MRYVKIRRRGAFDFPILGVAVALCIDDAGLCTEARVVLGARTGWASFTVSATSTISFPFTLRPGKAGPKGVEGETMKFGGVVQRVQIPPGEGKLAAPVASLATAEATTPAMRRRANVGAAACQPRKGTDAGVQGFVNPEDNNSVTVKESEQVACRRVSSSGAYEATVQGLETLTRAEILNRGAPVIVPEHRRARGTRAMAKNSAAR
jgi:hypothetical protein